MKCIVGVWFVQAQTQQTHMFLQFMWKTAHMPLGSSRMGFHHMDQKWFHDQHDSCHNSSNSRQNSVLKHFFDSRTCERTCHKGDISLATCTAQWVQGGCQWKIVAFWLRLGFPQLGCSSIAVQQNILKNDSERLTSTSPSMQKYRSVCLEAKLNSSLSSSSNHKRV